MSNNELKDLRGDPTFLPTWRSWQSFVRCHAYISNNNSPYKHTALYSILSPSPHISTTNDNLTKHNTRNLVFTYKFIPITSQHSNAQTVQKSPFLDHEPDWNNNIVIYHYLHILVNIDFIRGTKMLHSDIRRNITRISMI